MKLSPDIIIRPFSSGDRASLRRIAYETSFLGYPEKFLNESDLIMDVLTLYFTDYEPESCFVALWDNKVVGYVIGVKNSQGIKKNLGRTVVWPLIAKILKQGIVFKMSFLRLCWHSLLSFCKGEFHYLDVSSEYPALLHINLDKNFRKLGVGNMLIKHFEKYLQESNISGVHLGTMSESAKEFFIKNSYSVLYKSKRSYLRYQLGVDAPFFILGKKLR